MSFYVESDVLFFELKLLLPAAAIQNSKKRGFFNGMEGKPTYIFFLSKTLPHTNTMSFV